MKRLFWIALAIVLLPYPTAFLGLCAFISFYEPPPLPDPATIVILSAGQHADGTMGRHTTDRVRAGLAAYDPGDTVLVTGGRLTTHPDAIAEAMAVAVRKSGADPIVEPKARSTYENALNSAQLLAGTPDGPVILVTTRFHLPRAWIYFRNAGIDDITLLPAETAERHWDTFPVSVVRLESVKILDAIWASLFDDHPL